MLITSFHRQLRDSCSLPLGAGFLSLACSRFAGARSVLSTDGNGDIVASIERNLELNHSYLDRDRGAIGHIEARMLDWTDLTNLAETLLLQHKQAQRPRYDLVIGADITYLPEFLKPLVNTLTAIEALNPGITIIIAGAIRNTATYDTFLRECAEQGFTAEAIDFDCPPFHKQKGFFHNVVMTIKILHIKKTSG